MQIAFSKHKCNANVIISLLILVKIEVEDLKRQELNLKFSYITFKVIVFIK
jgi:hypothetical protein